MKKHFYIPKISPNYKGVIFYTQIMKKNVRLTFHYKTLLNVI